MSRVARSPSRKPAVRQRAPRGEGDKLRIEILEAAESLLVRTGNADDVSIRAISDAVGVTPPSIYRHFVDKDELVKAICELRFADLNAALDSTSGATDPVERLKEMGRAYGRFALEHPEHYRVLMMTTSSQNKATEAGEGQKAFGRLVQAVVECQSAGRMAGGDPVEIAVALWSGLHGLVSLLITSPNFPWPAPAERLLERVIDSQMDGLLSE